MKEILADYLHISEDEITDTPFNELQVADKYYRVLNYKEAKFIYDEFINNEIQVIKSNLPKWITDYLDGFGYDWKAGFEDTISFEDLNIYEFKDYYIEEI